MPIHIANIFGLLEPLDIGLENPTIEINIALGAYPIHSHGYHSYLECEGAK